MSSVSSSGSFLERNTIGEIQYNKDEFKSVFEHILIETNNICTRSCSYCYFGLKERKKEYHQLSEAIIYSIIDQLEEMDFSGRIGFFAINEPLTDTRIFDFIRYAKKLKNAWKTIITNGDLLTQEVLNKFVDAGLNQLSVSVYDAKILALKDTLVIPEGSDLILDFNDYRYFDLNDNRGGNIESIKYNGEYLKNSCERILKILVIKASGNVIPCFGDFFEQNILGNVYVGKLLKIWFGEKMSVFRSNLACGNRGKYKICEKCNYPGGGGFFTIPKKKNDNIK